MHNNGSYFLLFSVVFEPQFLGPVLYSWDRNAPHKRARNIAATDGCLPLDTIIAGNYTSEKSFARLFTGFTLLALFVACLGLFGLSAVILQQRRREPGIRRILGADPRMLTIRVTSGFTQLVLLANLIAAIPVWFIMKEWLAGFSFAVHFSVFTFVATALFTIILAWLTILWLSLRTTRLNPVEVIRYE